MPARSRRRVLRRRSVRAGWLDALEEQDPALAEELRALRRHNPQEYRKRIVRLSRALDLTPPEPEPEPEA